ncbi:MAG TPA: porin [Janthinobacterium sp.]|jgi:predicted porin|nr:porin [Janthinobacterium sp.]
MKAAHFAFAAFSLFAFAAQAQAQSAVNVYGLLDAGLVAERGCDNCASTKMSSGVASGSRLGVRGSEDLGNDVAAVFTLEAGVLVDTGRSDQNGRIDQNGRLFGRQAYVGLNSSLGALTLGRQYNLEYLALTDVADPFQGGMAGTATNLVGYTSKRYDNTIKYATPSLHGLTAAALYSFGETQYSSETNKAYGATLGYADGPVKLSIAYQRKYSMVGATAVVPAADNSARNTLVAANFNFGAAIAYAGLGRNRGQDSSAWDIDNPYGALAQTNPSTDSRDALIGIAMPRGATTYLASYIHKDDRSLLNQDANQIAIGVTYAFSKRTGFYAAYAKIYNKNGAAYTVGNETERGRGTSAVNLGLRHSF